MSTCLLNDLVAADYIAIAIGIALLVFGRKLYWLVLGGLGFLGGLWLASRYLDLGSAGLELGIAFLLGIVGAVAAVMAQKIAIAVGGFLIGGAAVLWLAQPYAPELGVWLWLLAILGAALGVFFAAILFEAALIVLSSLVGAGLIANASQLGRPRETWLFIILLGIGVMVQSARHRKLRRHRDDD
ncbi:MAG: hypothetical protein GY856_46200 [bacterium]|nr:hypothetical protein [bacterium]